jgi:PKHD-type hydroxylase|tara:strand:- start:1055 stop:1711 length:657 start_codon:yes stop_codon:yes gene_type:complete
MGQEMNWLIAPSSDGLNEEQWAYWDGAFTDEELETIIKLGDSRPKKYAVVGTEGKYVEEIRRSLVNFMDDKLLIEHAPFLLEKLTFICRKLNGSYFDFDLSGFHEPFQYTTYDPSDAYDNDGKIISEDKRIVEYKWHLDKGPGEDRPPRKLSMVLGLLDSDEYEGGDFEIKTGVESQLLPIKKGRVIAFPSWTLHRVTPVTKGIRKTVVIWVGGPKFK